MNFNIFINLSLNVFYLVFLSGVIFFQFISVSVSISIIWHAGLFFRCYSGNLPAMFYFLIGSVFLIQNVKVNFGHADIDFF